MIKNYVWFVHGHSFDRFSSFQSNQRDTLQLTSAKAVFIFFQPALNEMSTFDVDNFHVDWLKIISHIVYAFVMFDVVW